jgi:toxin HigB-1
MVFIKPAQSIPRSPGCKPNFLSHGRVHGISHSPTVQKFFLTYYVKRNRLQDMIKSFACRDTEALFNDRRVRRFQAIERQSRKRLMVLHAAPSLEALRLNPGNKLHALGGNRKGQWAISINDQWRICFEWRDGNAYQVQIIDYH